MPFVISQTLLSCGTLCNLTLHTTKPLVECPAKKKVDQKIKQTHTLQKRKLEQKIKHTHTCWIFCSGRHLNFFKWIFVWFEPSQYIFLVLYGNDFTKPKFITFPVVSMYNKIISLPLNWVLLVCCIVYWVFLFLLKSNYPYWRTVASTAFRLLRVFLFCFAICLCSFFAPFFVFFSFFNSFWSLFGRLWWAKKYTNNSNTKKDMKWVNQFYLHLLLFFC